MFRKLLPGVVAVTAAMFAGSANVRADAPDSGTVDGKLTVKPAVLTSNGEVSTPVSEVQYRRYYRRGWRGSPYRSWYGYSPQYRSSYYYPRYSYGYPYYNSYSYYRPYYSGYYYPRYYTGYRGFSYYGPRFSGRFYW